MASPGSGGVPVEGDAQGAGRCLSQAGITWSEAGTHPAVVHPEYQRGRQERDQAGRHQGAHASDP